MKKKSLYSGVVLFCMMSMAFLPLVSSAYVSTFGRDENRYFPNGTINNDFSYNNLDVQPADTGCVFRGTITNKSNTLQSVTVTAHAVDADGNELWQCTFSLPGVSAGDSYPFEQSVDDCSNTTPYRINFDISE